MSKQKIPGRDRYCQDGWIIEGSLYQNTSNDKIKALSLLKRAGYSESEAQLYLDLLVAEHRDKNWKEILKWQGNPSCS